MLFGWAFADWRVAARAAAALALPVLDLSDTIVVADDRCELRLAVVSSLVSALSLACRTLVRPP